MFNDLIDLFYSPGDGGGGGNPPPPAPGTADQPTPTGGGEDEKKYTQKDLDRLVPERGNRPVVIEQVVAAHADHRLILMGSGEGFGEIALLDHRPRTPHRGGRGRIRTRRGRPGLGGRAARLGPRPARQAPAGIAA